MRNVLYVFALLVSCFGIDARADQKKVRLEPLVVSKAIAAQTSKDGTGGRSCGRFFQQTPSGTTVIFKIRNGLGWRAYAAREIMFLSVDRSRKTKKPSALLVTQWASDGSPTSTWFITMTEQDAQEAQPCLPPPVIELDV